MYQLRTEVNKVLEAARTGKLIGPNLEAKVYLHTNDTYMHSKLQAMSSSKHDADRLHRIFVTSQVIVKIVECLFALLVVVPKA